MSCKPPHATEVIQIAHPPEHDTDESQVLRSLTRTCSDAVGVAAAGLLLADADGKLSTAAATGDPVELADLFDLQCGAGPCADSYHSASAVVETDLAAHLDRWPAFAPLARGAGVRGALAVPMRWHADTIGVLGMLSTRADAFGAHDAALGQCLADMASRCLYYQQSARSARTLAGQLQTALTSRVVIEQAKGMLAQRFGLVPDRAFEVLRTYCRTNRLKLADVCGQVTTAASTPRTSLMLYPPHLPASTTPPIHRRPAGPEHAHGSGTAREADPACVQRHRRQRSTARAASLAPAARTTNRLVVIVPAHLLDERAWCGLCQAQLSIEVAADYLVHYTCQNENCGQVRVQIDALEEAVTVQLFARLTSPVIHSEPDQITILAGVAQDIEETNWRLRDLDRQYKAGNLDRTVYLQVRREVYATGEGLRRLIDEPDDVDFATIATEAIAHWWLESPLDRRRELVVLLVDHVDVQPRPDRDESSATDTGPQSAHVTVIWNQD